MTEMTTGKMLFVLAIVLGCFAVLWPKIFYPMMFEASNRSSKTDALPRPGPEFNHPAFRNGKGRPIFPGDDSDNIRRTIERDLKPGPIPGMRPSMGGPGIQPQTQRNQGPMGILMPLYTVGIVCFFVYTIMKIIFKKPEDSEALDNQQSMTDQYSTLAEKYFPNNDDCTKLIDPLAKVATKHETLIEEADSEGTELEEITKDFSQLEQNNNEKTFCNHESGNCAIAEVPEFATEESTSQEIEVQESVDHKDVSDLDESKNETTKLSAEVNPTKENDDAFLDELIEKLKNSEENLKQLVAYINKTDPNFIQLFDDKNYSPSNSQFRNDANVNVIGVEKNVTGKVDRSDAIEAESKQATGSSTKALPPTAATATTTVMMKKPTKLHLLFSDRIKGMFKKSKKLQTKK